MSKGARSRRREVGVSRRRGVKVVSNMERGTEKGERVRGARIKSEKGD